MSSTLSCKGSQFLWFNNFITIDRNSVHFKELMSQYIKFISQLLTSDGEFKDKNHLSDNSYYKFTKISHAIAKIWGKKTESGDWHYIPRLSLN